MCRHARASRLQELTDWNIPNWANPSLNFPVQLNANPILESRLVYPIRIYVYTYRSMRNAATACLL